MRLRSFVIVFIVLLFLLGGIMQVFLWNKERSVSEEAAKVETKEKLEAFKDVVALKSEFYKKFAYNYSYWDELVNFLHTKNKKWAVENLDSGLEDFNATAMFILDTQKNIVYGISKEGVLKNPFEFIDKTKIETKSPLFAHFYKKTPIGIVEFFGAPIQKSADTKRETTPYGYLLIAKKWDEKYLKTIGDLGQLHLRLEDINEKYHTDEYRIYTDIILKDEHGKHISSLCVENENPVSKTINEYATRSLILNTIVALMFIFILILFTTTNVSIPLSDISDALRKKSPKPIKKYLTKKNEYGEISSLIVDFFQKETELEELNTTLKERVEAEVEKNRQKEQLIYQQSKQAAMGQMLNNIAHQWRQPLNAVSITVGKLEYASKKDILQKEDLDSSLQSIKSLVKQMSDTIDDFRNFFKPNKAKGYFSLLQCLKNSASVVSEAYESQNIKISIICDPQIECFGYERELMQVLLVCFGNSKDAIEENGVKEGKITVVGKQTPHGDVSITITDNGGGVKNEIIHDIFNPFFTTKEEGKGSGIGLYMSKQIIEQGMQGSIFAVNSTDGLSVTIEIPKELS